MGGFTIATTQIDQFMKPDEMSETSIGYGGLSSVGSAPRPGAIVRVAADHDSIVPRCPSECTTVADVVLDVVDEAPSRVSWSGRTSPMESVARRP